MSPFKRTGSPYWQVWPTIPYVGRIGPWSTRTKSKAQATAMERTIKELPAMGYLDLVEKLRDGEVSLQEVHVAKINHKLDDLRARLSEAEALANDPTLKSIIGSEEDRASFLATRKDERVRLGLRHLLRIAEDLHPGGEPRMSWLDAQNISKILARRESEGVRRNSVRRSLHRAISHVLNYHLGRSGKAAIMTEVFFPAEDDERDVRVTAEELDRLLISCRHPTFREAVDLAATSGLDRSPILRILRSDFDEATGILWVRDGKTRTRHRTLELPETAQTAIRNACKQGRVGPADRVFPFTTDQFAAQWKAARKRAQLPHVRFKDLRSVFATAYLEAGGSVKNLQMVLGHSDSRTTVRYLRRLSIKVPGEMQAAANLLGRGRHLKIEGTGT